MRILIRTKVEQPAEKVFARFDRDLFLALAPPFPPARLQRFDGCETGDEVHLQVWALGWRDWHALITNHRVDEKGAYFRDEGKVLPFFLRFWQHNHYINKEVNGSEIVDDIEYRTGSALTDLLFYPAFWLQFAYRKPIYRKLFKIGAA